MVRIRRTKKRLTPLQLARASGVSYCTILKYELNSIRSPRKEVAAKLAKVLGHGILDSCRVLPYRPPFGNLLRNCRKTLGLSLDALATQAGVSRMTIHYLETGRIKKPRIKTLRLLSQVLGEDFYNGSIKILAITHPTLTSSESFDSSI